jgi:hypothetical protein
LKALGSGINCGSANTGLLALRGVAIVVAKIGSDAGGADGAAPTCLRACFLAGTGDLRVAIKLSPLSAIQKAYREFLQKSSDFAAAIASRWCLSGYNLKNSKIVDYARRR